MRKIQPGQYKDKLCAWCSMPAQWRATRLASAKYSCDAHRAELQTQEQQAKTEYSDHMSEGDYQSWGRW